MCLVEGGGWQSSKFNRRGGPNKHRGCAGKTLKVLQGGTSIQGSEYIVMVLTYTFTNSSVLIHLLNHQVKYVKNDIPSILEFDDQCLDVTDTWPLFTHWLSLTFTHHTYNAGFPHECVTYIMYCKEFQILTVTDTDNFQTKQLTLI